ncbi:transmembrane protein [Achlya hypogyna]|uniref:Transmembrane protein n=1 Tax=Achlya hypogyna TaxID=1202772 RepID=A0A1V9Z6W6_ACHHY|nr:transmembrane protein [Achlya hypogyna]
MRFFFALLATALAAKSSSAPVVIQPTSVKWALTFEDNFNTLNLSTWRLSHDCSTNNGCVHNNELQVYLANQVSVKSGNLVIEATNAPYTSAAADGEIDIMEYIGTKLPNTIHGNYHFGNVCNNDLHSAANRCGVTGGAIDIKLGNGFHVYAEWTSQAIKWFVDSQLYYTLDATQCGSAFFLPRKAFYPIFNFAIGGDWPGSPDSSTVFPQRMFIDYLRVYKLAAKTATVGMPAPVPDAWLDSFVVPAIYTTSSLSLLGCAFIIGHVVRSAWRGDVVDFTMRMILVMSFIDLFDAFFKVFGTHPYTHPHLCNVQGFVMNAAGISAVSWLSCMSHSWYCWVVSGDGELKLRSRFPSYVAVSFLPSIVVSLYLGVEGKYGPATFYCWIADTEQDLRLSCFFTWVGAAALFIVSTSFLVCLEVSRRAKLQENTEADASVSTIYNKLAAYVTVFVFVWGPCIVNRLVEWRQSSTDPPTLWLLGTHIVCNNSQGFLNAMIYGGAFRLLKRRCCDDREEDTVSIRTSLCSTLPLSETPSQSLSIFATTFNMGEGSAPTDLSQWIPLGHDLYVVGVQECLDLAALRSSIMSYLERGSRRVFVDYSRDIGSKNTALGYHGYIGVLIFVPQETVASGRFSMPTPTNPEVNCGKTLNVRTSNKGAVGFAFRYLDTSIAVVSCHLASDGKGKSQLQRRNEDAALVWQSLHLSGDDHIIDFPLLHHHTIVLGDFNYRLSRLQATPETVLSLVESAMQQRRWPRSAHVASPAVELVWNALHEDDASALAKPPAVDGVWSPVLEHDELRAVLHHHSAFAGFAEAPISFPPTFRRIRGMSLVTGHKLEDCYSLQVANGGGVRVPSYTDRILFHSLDDVKGNLSCSNYRSHESVDTSDHKPVSCVFLITAKESPFAGASLSHESPDVSLLSDEPRPSKMTDYHGVKDCTVALADLSVRWVCASPREPSTVRKYSDDEPPIDRDDKAQVTTMFPLPLEDIFAEQRKLHELAARWEHGVLHSGEGSGRHRRNFNHFNAPWEDAVARGIVHRCYAQAKRHMHLALSIHTRARPLGQCVLSLDAALAHANQNHWVLFEQELTTGGVKTGVLRGRLMFKSK